MFENTEINSKVESKNPTRIRTLWKKSQISQYFVKNKDTRRKKVVKKYQS